MIIYKRIVMMKGLVCFCLFVLLRSFRGQQNVMVKIHHVRVVGLK